MFRETHTLISRTSGQETPVCLMPTAQPDRFWVLTVQDWQKGKSLIEYFTHRGLFCQGVQLINFCLRPVAEKDADQMVGICREKSKTCQI